MSKRDITDWTQKGRQKITKPSGPSTTAKIKDTAGKAGLLMCAAAVIAVLAKAVKEGGLEEYQQVDEEEVLKEAQEEAEKEAQVKEDEGTEE